MITPTSSSWMNLVERFFRDLTEFITEKSFASTRELADAIIAFLAARNDNPRRYVWKAKGEDIIPGRSRHGICGSRCRKGRGRHSGFPAGTRKLTLNIIDAWYLYRYVGDGAPRGDPDATF
jgi:hypothetical protein